jgi:hypothetical protein
MDGSHIMCSGTKVQKQPSRAARACGTSGDDVRTYVGRMRVPERQGTSRIICGWDIQGRIHVEEMDWPELYRKFLLWHDREVLYRNVGLKKPKRRGNHTSGRGIWLIPVVRKMTISSPSTLSLPWHQLKTESLGFS